MCTGAIPVNPDGIVDATFPAGEPTNRTVLAIAVDDDGSILVGGKFTQIQGSSIRGMGKLNPDGSLDENFETVVEWQSS